MPEHRQKGIGSALFDRLLSALKEHQAITLHTSLQEDNPAGLHFAQKCGFEISTTRYPSILETATFDASPYDALFARLEAEGIQFFSYASLASDPERDEKMLVLQTVLEQDVPLPIPATPLSLEQYRKEFLLNPRFDPEASMIAIHQGNYVGLTIVFREINQILGIDFTGVASSYRGKGIATALKVRMAQFARANHLPSIHTTNDAVNAAILGVNDKMGFVRQPATLWLDLNL
jgi:mycothiol synthase